MAAFKRTAEGIEVAHKTALGVVGLFLLLVGAVAMGLRTTDQIRGAVQRSEFHDTTRSIRHEVKTMGDELRSTSRNVLGMQCRSSNFPSPFCDSVPRVYQAGAARGRP